ncbi:hypothetical protein AA313_de0208278 [Arthrobotrys entomopaga]|nr:hypothetical protein AA313_de0208278 [Arthrobotrys entomopaga]
MSSLPEAILHTYKGYKKDTGEIIDWLHSNSRLSNNVSQTPKQKAEAESKSKDQANANHSYNNSKSRQLQSKDLITFAKSIVANRIKIPSNIIDVLNKVIIARSRCAKWYSAQSHVRTIEHERHEHFIRILQEVHDILQPSKETSVTKENERLSPGGLKKVENLFEHLQLEELLDDKSVDDDDYLPQDLKPKPKPKDIHIPTPQENLIEEKLFAIFCFFEEILNIRLFIQDVWTDYAAGKLTLATAATTTNTAFDLLKHANEELISNFPDLDDHEKVAKFFEQNGFSLTVKNKKEPKGKPGNEPLVPNLYPESDDPEHMEIHQLASRMCMRTWEWHLKPRIRNEVGLPPMKVVKNKMHQGKISLIDNPEICDALLLDYLLFSQYTAGAMGYQLTTGLKKALDSKPRSCPTWLVLAFDMIIKLSWTLWVGGTQEPYVELQRYLEDTKARLSRFIKFTKTWDTLGFSSLAKDKDRAQEVFLSRVSMLAFWTNDFVQKIKSEAYKSAPEYLKQMETEEHFMLKHDPVICGLIIADLQHFIHSHGIRLGLKDEIIAATAHLYNAARLSSFLKESWKDMEDLIAIHSLKKSIFLGDRPATVEDCVSRIWTASGFQLSERRFFMDAFDQGCPPNIMKAAALFSHCRNPRLVERLSKTRRAELDITSVYTKFLWTVKRREDLSRQETRAPDDITEVLPVIVDSQIKRYLKLQKDPSSSRLGYTLDEKIITKWRRNQRLDQLELLKVFSQTLEADEFHISFDYLAMLEKCANLLYAFGKEAKAATEHDLGIMGPSAYYEPDGNGVMWVLLALQGWEKFGKSPKYIGDNNATLRIASRCLSQLIDKEGCSEYLKSHAVFYNSFRSVGYIDFSSIPDYGAWAQNDISTMGKFLCKAFFSLDPQHATFHLLRMAPQDPYNKETQQKFARYVAWDGIKAKGLPSLSHIGADEAEKIGRQGMLVCQLLERLDEVEKSLDLHLTRFLRRYILVSATRSDLPSPVKEILLQTCVRLLREPPADRETTINDIGAGLVAACVELIYQNKNFHYGRSSAETDGR